MSELKYGHPSCMGNMVVVSSVLEKDWKFKGQKVTRTWKSTGIDLRAGWIVGTRSLRGGLVGVDENGLRYLSNSISYQAYLVSFWPNQKSVYVSPDSLRLWKPGDPKPKGRTAKHCADLKKFVAAHQAFFPRDSKGRFVSIPLPGYNPCLGEDPIGWG